MILREEHNTWRAELMISYVLCVEVFRSVIRLTIEPTIQTLILRSAHAKSHNSPLGDLQGITIVYHEHKWFESGVKEAI